MMKKVFLAIWLPVSILGGWQTLVAVGVLDPLFFPPPSALVAAAGSLVKSGELGKHLQATVSRLLVGFLLGSLIGLICGVLMGAVEGVRKSIEPIVSALNATPKLSLLPMLMLLLGVGESPRTVLIAAGCFVMLAIHGLDAVRGISPGYLDLARNYGASPAMVFRKVYLPASLPQVFTGLRIALGRALTVTIALELVSCPDGIGSMIWMAWQTFSTERLYVGVITAALLGALCHNWLARLERRLIPWKT